ncbi:PAS domain S-box protein [Prosthecobacter sp.]|uniref:PAS domain S-box protein n=1 Tax=Prosthecobacter sp. TaxID=1965333 RepID=UPI0025F4DEE1|nr:PAS domain S-box protein [Prosthecobacter sp.]
MDDRGTVVAVHGTWNPFHLPSGEKVPLPQCGEDCFEILGMAAMTGCEWARCATEGLRQVLRHKKPLSRFEFRLPVGQGASLRIQNITQSFSTPDERGALINWLDITQNAEGDPGGYSLSTVATSRICMDFPAVILTDMDGHVCQISEHFADVAGALAHVSDGIGVESLVHPDDTAQMLQAVASIRSGESEHAVIEVRLPGRMGEAPWFECKLSVIKEPSGKPKRMVFLWSDLASIHQGRTELRLLQTSVAMVNDIVLITEAEPIDEPGPRIVFVNEAFTRLTGYSPGEVIGRSPRFLQGPETDRGALGRIRAALAGHKPVKEELINYTKSGEAFCLEIDIVPISDAGGRTTHFAAIQRDISARKEAEQKLLRANRRYSEQRRTLARLMKGGLMQAPRPDEAFREITELIADVMKVERVSIWRFSSDRSSIFCHALFEASSRYHSAGLELLERDFPSYFAALAHNELISADDAVHDARTCEFANSYLRPLGITSMLDAPLHVGGQLAGVLCHEHIGPPRTWGEEEQSFAVSLANFISLLLAQWEHRQSEEKLRQQASLLDKANDAILVRELDHTVTYWNKSAEKLYGWTSEEALGRKVSELIYKDTSQFDEQTAKVLTDGEWKGEIRQSGKHGEDLMIEAHWTLVRDPEGRPKSILSINTDITRKKLLEDQIYRSQRMESIGTLAGGVAHDLNNILTPIMMAVDLLKKKEASDTDHESLDSIAANARRGAEMIRQLLSFAKGVEGRRLPVSVSEALQEVRRFVRDSFPKNITLKVHSDEDLEPIAGDPTQLHQVLLNLCVNARDAMPTGGELKITAQNIEVDAQYAAAYLDATPGQHIMITVEDNGAGMTSDVMDKMFEPFFTTKEIGKGTGLGLSTSLAIIKSHGGFVAASSQPGKGSRLAVYLPTGQFGTLVPPATEHEPTPEGAGEVVLVVDDEASVRDITRRTLESHGYRVLLASDGAEAVSVYSNHQNEIALVLTDMMMPVMDGLQTIQVLTKIDPAVRIIAASGVLSPEGQVQAAKAGIVHFLAKPYDARTMLRALHDVLHAAKIPSTSREGA